MSKKKYPHVGKAEKEAVAGELQLRCGLGLPYPSRVHFTKTQEFGIPPSLSRRGNLYDNALAKNFFSLLKTECISRQKILFFEQVGLLIDDDIRFLSFERSQLKCRLALFQKRGQSA